MLLRSCAEAERGSHLEGCHDESEVLFSATHEGVRLERMREHATVGQVMGRRRVPWWLDRVKLGSVNWR